MAGNMSHQVQLITSSVPTVLQQEVSIRDYISYQSLLPDIFTEIRSLCIFRLCDIGSCKLLVGRNNFSPADVLLSCSVYRTEKPLSPVFEPRTHFRSFGMFKISSFSQGTSKPNLMQISLSVLEP